jgi:hypothetical protein
MLMRDGAATTVVKSGMILVITPVRFAGQRIRVL